MIGPLIPLLPLALVAALVAGVVAARRAGAESDDASRGGVPVDPGIGTARRLFLYGLALVALSFAGAGLSMLIGRAIDDLFGGVIVAEQHRQLAVALSFTVVGAPAWLLFAALAQRSVAQHPVETRSQVRRLYLVLASGIGLTIAVFSAIEVAAAVVGVGDRAAAPWGSLVVWGVAWAVHRRVAALEPATTGPTRAIERLLLYYGALLALGVVVVGSIATLQASLSELYDRLVRESLVLSGWSEHLRRGLVTLAVGAAVWWWHWLRDTARRDAGTTLWQVAVFLFGILGGIALAVVPAALLLYAVLQWYVGEPGATSASAHFAFAPGAASVLLVGLGAWAYHRALLIDAIGDRSAPSGPERLYRYLVAAAGLTTTAVGVATLLALAGAVLGSAGDQLVRGAGWWRNPLVRGVTLLAVGAPLWDFEWRTAQRALRTAVQRSAAAGADTRAARNEVDAPERRVYVFAAAGVAVVALLVALTAALYQLFQAALDGTLTRVVLADARWSVAVALTAGAIAGYHLLVLREDRRALAAVGPAVATAARPAAAVAARVREVVVLGAGPAVDAASAALADAPGVRVRAWHAAGATPSARVAPPEEVARLVDRVLQAPGDRVTVTETGAGFDVAAYTEEASPGAP